MDKGTKIVLACALVLLLIIVGLGIMANRLGQKKEPTLKAPVVLDKPEAPKPKQPEKTVEQKLPVKKLREGTVTIPPEMRVSPPIAPPMLEGQELPPELQGQRRPISGEPCPDCGQYH